MEHYSESLKRAAEHVARQKVAEAAQYGKCIALAFERLYGGAADWLQREADAASDRNPEDEAW